VDGSVGILAVDIELPDKLRIGLLSNFFYSRSCGVICWRC